ncbi:MAG: DNA/RNA helicase domain-containing protein [Polymorphobacter sp.]|uniref:DNA/RNA helicase domain-containing protein n=1 Tax=Polymorphobacter sp. TaxID=1909290 RepID=UPI003A8C11C9
MSRAYFDAPGEVLAAMSDDDILGKLARASTFADDPEQKAAWQFEVTHLKDLARALGHAHFFIEFTIPRMGRRADAVIVAGPLIFVLEYKVGARDFPRHATEQAHGYALDLKNFHATSHDKAIVPILISTRAPSQQLDLGFWAPDRVNSPLKCAPKDVLPTISQFLATGTGAPIDADAWAGGAYLPTPTIIEAAEALYAGHDVKEISRSEAGAENLTRTAAAIEAVVARAKAQGGKAICFVTGVPGAGKTLAGLNIATGRLARDIGEDATYLSGNGPLVEVLQTALKRDLARRARTARQSKETLHLLGRSPDKLIQAVHKFRDEALKHHGPPSEHVVIFDEAQRAWGQEKATAFLAKRGHHDFSQSEPAFLLSVMDRRPDWCVVVCLIGDGQEIHDGEAGIAEWFRALQAERRHWKIHAPPRLLEATGPLDAGLRWFAAQNAEPPEPALHLAVPVRSFRSDKVSNYVAALLGEDAAAAAALRPDPDQYPIVRTRSLKVARAWLRAKRRGLERSGLLASSNALRLRPEGLFVKAKIDGPVWFLNDIEDVRSSSALEDVATEFDVQGLELDWTCVAWDLNLRRADGWEARQFHGTAWKALPKSRSGISTAEYVRNAYRVLLTRARQGMVLFIPHGDSADRTRPPTDYDAIDAWLAACGIPKL